MIMVVKGKLSMQSENLSAQIEPVTLHDNMLNLRCVLYPIDLDMPLSLISNGKHLLLTEFRLEKAGVSLLWLYQGSL